MGLALLCGAGAVSSFQELSSHGQPNRDRLTAMISVMIMYPKTDDSTFDMDYYKATHMPMFAESLGDACQGWGAATIKTGKWEAVGWAMVDSQEALDAAMAEHGAKIMGDIPNYTNVAPELVVGDVA